MCGLCRVCFATGGRTRPAWVTIRFWSVGFEQIPQKPPDRKNGERVVGHRLFEECPQGADPASLGLARVSMAGSCGVDRFVLGADLLGLGVAMRTLLARCSGESSGGLDVYWLGGSRGDGVAR